MQTILDFHAHAYPPRVAGKAVEFLNRYYHLQCRGDGTIGDLIDSAKKAGVDYLLVHAVATKPNQVENVNGQLTEHVLGFGTLHPGYAHIPAEIERIRSLGLRGVKLHPDFQAFNVDDPATDAIYGGIEGELPVLVHAGDKQVDYSAPRRIANVLDRYPRLTLIAAHLGGYSQWDEAEEYLIGRNCYIDTSSAIWAIGPARSAELIRKHGVERVLFGTDYPLVRHTEELARFHSLGLTPEEERLILFENAKRLLGLAGD